MPVLKGRKAMETRHRYGNSEGKLTFRGGPGEPPMSMTLSTAALPGCCMNAEHASRENGTEEHHPDWRTREFRKRDRRRGILRRRNSGNMPADAEFLTVSSLLREVFPHALPCR